MSVEFVDNSDNVIMVLEYATVAGLEAAAAMVEAQAVRNTPVASGQLRGAWGHVVDEDEMTATIGNRLENAIWTEFGTGEYALNRDGRQTPWRYQDAKGDWHTTTGKPPVRMLFNAFTTKKNAIVRIIEQEFKKQFK